MGNVSFDLLLIVLVSFFTTFLSTPIIRKIALKFRVIDRPDTRKAHKKIITNLGGIGIFLGFIFGSILAFILNPDFSDYIREFLIFLFSVTLVFLLGIYDDLKKAKAGTKVAIEIFAILLLIRHGIYINRLSFFGKVYELPYIMGVLFTLAWFILITNAINLIDGIDGLASGIVVISSFGLFLILGNGDNIWSIMLLALCFSHLAFLRYNFPPAKIFMGDCGALTSGFVLAGVSLLLEHKRYLLVNLAIPLILLFIPLFDTFLAIIRRILKRKSIFLADKEHIHHFLLKKGLSPKRILLYFYTLTILLCLLAYMLKNKYL
jgi:UDP-GlcNAc:undecaprenyl-phosphate GlcNAc-1-phosphate transferase